jgi:hypothetical protein
MRISLKSSALGLAVVGALAIAAPAWAGCGDVASKTPAKFDTGKAGDAQLIRVSNEQGNGPSIAGLWNVTFYQGNTSTVFDYGYAAWHSDGTEIMNSATRTPSSENFCMGVWTQTGPLSFRLIHYALSYDPAAVTTQNPAGLAAKVAITENVTLNGQGNAFAGSYSMVIYPYGGGNVTGPSGKITGQRLTAN